MSDHTITWTHGDGEGVDANVTCTAPEGAPCRLSCPAGCETWWLTGHEHGLEVVPCLAVEWWAQHMSTVECGPTNSVGEPVRNGPVDIEWDGDDWLWEYADEPTPTAPARDVLVEVAEELGRQDRKWGEQNHPDGSSPFFQVVRNGYRDECDRAAKAGLVTWRHILLEEVYEALAEDDPAKLREELVQVAAVAAQWIGAVDRRTPGATP